MRPRRRRLVHAVAGVLLAVLASPTAAATAPEMLVRADGLLRGGHLPEARRLMNDVIEQFPDTAWARWGAFGLGFLELSRGRMADARPYYEAAAVGIFDDPSRIVLALLDAQDGKTADAAAVLDGIANDPSRRSPVREAAGLAAGYARYWAGAYDEAALAFAAVADSHPGGALEDDALYGLAQSFLRLGDPTSAEELFERISELPAQAFDDERVRPALRTLSLRELLRATRQRYDSVPIGQADQMLLALLDVNGRALATGSLASLAKSVGRTAAGTNLGDAARNAAAAMARRRRAADRSTDAPAGTPPAGAHKADAGAAESAGNTADPATARAGGTPRVRTHRGRAGGLVVFSLLATVIVLVVRRTVH